MGLLRFFISVPLPYRASLVVVLANCFLLTLYITEIDYEEIDLLVCRSTFCCCDGKCCQCRTNRQWLSLYATRRSELPMYETARLSMHATCLGLCARVVVSTGGVLSTRRALSSSGSLPSGCSLRSTLGLRLRLGRLVLVISLEKTAGDVLAASPAR